MADSEFQVNQVEVYAAIMVGNDVRLVGPLNDVDALALPGCMAEDPISWDDVAVVWPRYVYHAENTEFANLLPHRDISIDTAVVDLRAASAAR